MVHCAEGYVLALNCVHTSEVQHVIEGTVERGAASWCQK